MHAKRVRLAGVGLSVALLVWPITSGWPGEKARTTGEVVPASMALVGTIVAIIQESRTVIVDVPLGWDFLRVAAGVTDATTVTQAGRAAALGSLAPGARVRIVVRRVADGNEAVVVEVLSGTTR